MACATGSKTCVVPKNTMSNDSLLFVYEPAHVPLAKSHEGVVVALDQEVLVLLQKEGVRAVAITDISTSPDGDRELLERTRAMAREWYDSREMSFLVHDGINAGEQYEVVVLYYIQTLHYYVSVLSQALKALGNIQEVVVPETHIRVPDTADPTAKHKENLPVDAARLVCAHLRLSLVVVPAPASFSAKGRALWRSLAQELVRVAVSVINAGITYTTRPRPVKLFSSDPWYRIKPFVESMKDVELVMSRRAELMQMGIAAAWRARARFHHGLDFADAAVRKEARRAAKEMQEVWERVRERPALSRHYTCDGIDYWPVARQVFDSIIKERLADDIATIESSKRLFKHYNINCVLLFASTKGYNLVLSRVAERMGIPSIELQHALTNNEKSLVHCRLNSRYLASYGPLTNSMYESWGVRPERLVSVGSPRFDMYAHPDMEAAQALRERLGVGNEVSVLCNIPQIYLSLEYGNYTSWDVYDYVQNLAWALRQVPVRPLLRPKPGQWHQSFYDSLETKELFSQGSMVQQESLQALLWMCDIVVSSSSTMVLEALLAHKPTIMYVPKLLDHDFDAFERSGAVRMARTKEELAQHVRELAGSKEARERQLEAGDTFIEESFKTDGGSAARVAELVRRVTKEGGASTMAL